MIKRFICCASETWTSTSVLTIFMYMVTMIVLTCMYCLLHNQEWSNRPSLQSQMLFTVFHKPHNKILQLMNLYWSEANRNNIVKLKLLISIGLSKSTVTHHKNSLKNNWMVYFKISTFRLKSPYFFPSSTHYTHSLVD